VMIRRQSSAGGASTSSPYASPQPNVPGKGILAGYSRWFWVSVIGIGLAAGIGGAALMALLRLVEKLSYGYSTGGYLPGIEQASGGRRVLVLGLAGVIAAVGGYIVREVRGSGAGEVSDALWTSDARLPFARSLAKGVLSIVIVGMGASLGREAAPQLAGAASASRLSELAGLPAHQRRLLVACGAGAGMAAGRRGPSGLPPAWLEPSGLPPG